MDIIKHKDQPASRSQRKKYLYKLMLARSDMNATISACKLMLSTVTGFGHELYYPLYASIIICYARPFTKNKPYGALPNKWQRFDSQEGKRTHQKILRARHELVAHSDMTVRKAMIVPAGVVIGEHDGKQIRSPEIGTKTTLYYFPIKFFSSVHSNALEIGSRLNQEIDIIVAELYSDMELPGVAFDLRIDEGL
jgi:hypothetical protein